MKEIKEEKNQVRPRYTTLLYNYYILLSIQIWKLNNYFYYIFLFESYIII